MLKCTRRHTDSLSVYNPKIYHIFRYKTYQKEKLHCTHKLQNYTGKCPILGANLGNVYIVYGNNRDI